MFDNPLNRLRKKLWMSALPDTIDVPPVGDTGVTVTKPIDEATVDDIHCSASDHAVHDDAAVIDQWHRQRGWRGIGYHFFIRGDGTIQRGRPLEQIPAAQEGHNSGSIAICLHGFKTFTPAQFDALRRLADAMDAAYAGQGKRLRWRGHREVAAKLCPNFDYRAVLGLDEDGFRSACPST